MWKRHETAAQRDRRERKHERRQVARAPIAVRHEASASMWTRAKAWFGALRVAAKVERIAPRCTHAVAPTEKRPDPQPCGGRLSRITDNVGGRRDVVGLRCQRCGRQDFAAA